MTGAVELSSSLEDYLEAIAELADSGGKAHCNDIAQRLNVKKPSVTTALQTLMEKGLIDYRPYMPISLTRRGKAVADKIISRHNALRDFFVKILNIDSTQADEAACKMEHAIGEEISGRFIEFVKFMETCPLVGVKWTDRHGYSCVAGDSRDYCRKCVEKCLNSLPPENEANAGRRTMNGLQPRARIKSGGKLKAKAE